MLDFETGIVHKDVFHETEYMGLPAPPPPLNPVSNSPLTSVTMENTAPSKEYTPYVDSLLSHMYNPTSVSKTYVEFSHL